MRFMVNKDEYIKAASPFGALIDIVTARQSLRLGGKIRLLISVL